MTSRSGFWIRHNFKYVPTYDYCLMKIQLFPKNTVKPVNKNSYFATPSQINTIANYQKKLLQHEIGALRGNFIEKSSLFHTLKKHLT